MLDELYFEHIHPEDISTMCPKFQCFPERFKDFVQCQHQDITNPLFMKLRNCNEMTYMRHSDFFGNLPKPENKLFCHQKLNRCMEDPYVKFIDKLPGDKCWNNFECKSQRCEELV